ncbi:MAG: hypothetical protein A3F14_02715 [Gammaproteobacteria bacterium RIFCSPHIGHO2_12_FULL_43_28]|nr:MAG: hypothetical protein A3F14_02715 [Gammaproteobacteria bacterium RIFCSPHIGHO2_12_FULL_43_28]
MLTQFFTIGILVLLSAMLPGPDFALVTKNTILHSRRAGMFTALGIASACAIHITYCLMGLALVISNSLIAFTIIKYVGATYLLYLGITSLLSQQHVTNDAAHAQKINITMTDVVALRQGFFCNIFNPKATLFFLALFTVIISPNTPRFLESLYAIEMMLIILGWFSGLVLLLSHPHILRLLNRIEKYISKLLGVALIGFGIALLFAGK